jgi:hypothetical protein
MSLLQQWARVQPDLNYRLRRGAWYRVVRFNLVEAVLDVNQQSAAVPLEVLEIRTQRPKLWTVVGLPRDAVDIPFSWGSRYAVCPNCSKRAPIAREVPAMRCPSCSGVFEIAWSEKYFS